MRVSDLLRLSRARLRARTIRAQDGCAVLGLAVGVALLFASQIASASLSHSVGAITREVVGRTQWQISARGPAGMSETLLAKVRRLPVRLALPLVEESGVASGRSGARSIELFGTNPRQAQLAGTTLGRLTASQLSNAEAVALPSALASELGVESLEPIHLQLGGTRAPVLVGATLGAHKIGALVDSPLVFVPLRYAQQLTHMQGRLSRIFVAALPGQGQTVRRGLVRLAAGSHLNLEPSNWESTLFATAFSPQDQSEQAFSVIAALVGFLLAANAILITVPSRRRLIEDLRLAGAPPGRMLMIMLVDALLMGCLACLIGLALGDALSRTLFAGSPGYLSFAFPVGSAQIVTWQSVAISVVVGMGAAVLGVLGPVRREILVPHGHQQVSRASRHLLRWQLAAGASCIAVAVAILLARPAWASFGALALLVAMICLLRPLYAVAIGAFAALQHAIGGVASKIAVLELESPVTRVRSLAIAATIAAAVFGVLALAGAQANLQQGLDASAHKIDSGAEIWVTPAGQNNAFATTPIRSGQATAARLAAVPGVASVGAYGGTFLNWGPRRLWVLGPPSSTNGPLPVSQLLGGSLSAAAASVRDGRGVLLSKALASEHHLRVGEAFVLPSPTPIKVRLAGLITNLGWPPGALIIGSAAYMRAWAGTPPSAYEINAKPGIPPPTLEQRIRRALAGEHGLIVETASRREARHRALARQGLSRLTQIHILMVIAAVLATAGALAALLWQRRDRLAYMRVLGYGRRVLWSAVCCEILALLATGCVIGAIFGVVGQLMLSHALASVTGFPIVFNVELGALANCLLIGAVAGIASAAIGYPVVSARPSTASSAY